MPTAAKNVDVDLMGATSQEHASHLFFTQLLELALAASLAADEKLNLRYIKHESITHERSVKLLADGHIDALWLGVTKAREKDFRRVGIPLLGGVLGMRMSLVSQSNFARLRHSDADELTSLIACQGKNWPDAHILLRNGFKVLQVQAYGVMFDMLMQRRCDYYPRSIMEGYAEEVIAQERELPIVAMDDVLLFYNFPTYFYVDKDNEELAARLTAGLHVIKQNGQLVALMKSHEVTKYVFPLSKWRNKTILVLDNPDLPNNLKTIQQQWIVNEIMQEPSNTVVQLN